MRIDRTDYTPGVPSPKYDQAARGRGSASGTIESHAEKEST